MRSVTSLKRSLGVVIAVLAGCTEPRAERAYVGLALNVQSSHPTPVTVTLSIGGASIQLTTAPGGRTVANELQVSPMAAVPLRVVAASMTGDSLAEFATSQDLQANYEYGFETDIGRARPVSICGAVVAAVPLRMSANDTLFVFSTGGIPVGAVC